MAEQLINSEEAARRLGISAQQFRRWELKLRAAGLQRVQLGARRRYRAASLDRVIARAAENERPLIPPGSQEVSEQLKAHKRRLKLALARSG